MKKRTTMIWITLMAICLITPAAFAQGRARGRYYTKSSVEKIIKRVETRSDYFKNTIDKNLDHSALDGTRREDNINEQVKQFERTLDELRSEFDKRDRWLEVRNQVGDVLRQADEVGRIVKIRHFNAKVEAGWVALRRDLNTLAGVYELPHLRY